MAQAQTIRIQGLREVMRDFGKMSHKLRGELQRELKKAGEPVADEAKQRAQAYGGRTVSGIRVRARGASVFVEQGTRKVTGLRPDFGSLQMRRVFLPALAAREDETIREIEKFLDRFTDENGF